MKTIQSIILFAGFGLLLAGCTATAHIEKDEAVNFSQYKTFAWLDESEDSGSIKKNSLQETNLRQAVNAELSKSNWNEEKKKPDVILKHDVLVEKTTKESSNPVYSQGYTRRYYNPYTRRFNFIFFPSQFMGYNSNEYQTREGTLTITMIDAKTDRVVWQGWTTNEVSNKNLTSKEIQDNSITVIRKTY